MIWLRFLPGSFVPFLTVGLVLFFPPPSARAQSIWNTGDRSWFNNINWTPAGVPTTGSVFINNGGTARAAGGNATGGSLELGSLSGDSGTVIVGLLGSLTVSGDVIVGGGGDGELQLRLGGTLSAGRIVVAEEAGSSGLIDFQGASTVYTGGIQGGDGDAYFFAQNTTLVATADNAAFISGFQSGQIELSGLGMTVDTNGFDVEIRSEMDGDGRLIKTGAGTLTVSATQYYLGTTRIDEGTLRLTGIDSVGFGDIILNNIGGGEPILEVAEGAETNTLVLAYGGGTVINNGLMNSCGCDPLIMNMGGGINTVINNGVMYGAGPFVAGDLGAGTNLTNNGTMEMVGALPSDAAAIGGVGSTFLNSATGRILSDQRGVILAAGTLTNAGLISAMEQGVVTLGQSTITNSGVIEAENGAAIVSLFAAGGINIVNEAGGEIRSNGPVTILSALGTTTLSNAGTIIGNVVLGLAQPNTVTLFNGSNITGALVVGGDPGSQVILDGEGTSKMSDAVGQFFMGSGSLVKQGGGTWILDQAMPYAGTTTVNAGTLYLNGSVTGDVVVNGGIFGGTGTVGGNLNNLGGTVNVGNSPGILNVGGNFTQGAGGTFLVEVAGNVPGQYDQLNVAGTATMGGALVLQILPGYVPVAGETYNFLTAGGGGIGQFATFTTNLNGSLGAILSYGSDGLPFITIVQGSFSPFARTPNQRSVAANLDRVLAAGQSPALFTYLNSLPGAFLPEAYDQISPDEYGSMSRPILSYNAVQQSNLQRRFADLRAGATGFSANGFTLLGFDRSLLLAGGGDAMASQIAMNPNKSPMRVAKDNKWGFFVNGTGQFGDIQSDGNGGGYEFTTGGINLGLDYRLCESLVLGGSLGYANSSTDMGGAGGSIQANNAKALLYASWFKDGLYANGAVGGGGTSYDTRRNVLGSRVTGDTSGGDFTTFIGTGYDFKAGALTIGPAASLEYSYVNVSGFTESGGLVPLQIQDQNFDSLRSRLGLLASYLFEAGDVRIIPTLNAAWQHEFLETAGSVSARFANGAGGVFGVQSAEAERDSAIIGLGVNVEWTPALSTYLAYDAEAADRFLAQSVSGGVKVKF